MRRLFVIFWLGLLVVWASNIQGATAGSIDVLKLAKQPNVAITEESLPTLKCVLDIMQQPVEFIDVP